MLSLSADIASWLAIMFQAQVPTDKIMRNKAGHRIQYLKVSTQPHSVFFKLFAAADITYTLQTTKAIYLTVLERTADIKI